jgi:hypothetical protein
MLIPMLASTSSLVGLLACRVKLTTLARSLSWNEVRIYTFSGFGRREEHHAPSLPRRDGCLELDSRCICHSHILHLITSSISSTFVVATFTSISASLVHLIFAIYFITVSICVPVQVFNMPASIASSDDGEVREDASTAPSSFTHPLCRATPSSWTSTRSKHMVRLPQSHRMWLVF